MTHTEIRSAYDNIRDAVISLGMEISEPILASLADSVVVARLENKERLAIVDPLLLGIEAIAHHIDGAGAASDPRAFSLLNELLEVYRQITVEVADDVKAQKMAADGLKQVLEWQNDCMLPPGERAKPVSAALAGSGQDLALLLLTVQEEIAETRRLADMEITAVQDAVLATAEGGGSGGGSLSTVIAESVDEVQQALQQEITSLRRELGLAE